MKNTLIVVALLVGMLFSVAFAQSPKTTAWEYKTEDRCFDEKRINALGAEGWEVAGYSETNRGGWHCIFKRQK